MGGGAWCSASFYPNPNHPNPMTDVGTIVLIPAAQIEPDPEQPRKQFDPQYLNDLAESIAAEGLLQPITVRPHPSKVDHFMIIAGECRWRAHCLKGIQAVKCIVSAEHGDPIRRLRAQTMENRTRKEMTFRDEAQAYQRLHDIGDSDEEIGRANGMSGARVKTIRGMLSLGDVVWRQLESGAIRRRVAEWVCAEVPAEHAEGLLLRCAGKTSKQAIALVSDFLAELRQDRLELAFDEAGMAGGKDVLVRELAKALLMIFPLVEAVGAGDQAVAARSLGNEIARCLPKGKKTKRAAAFLAKACAQIDAISNP